MIQKNFFKKKVKNAQNRSIRKVIYLKSIFQHPHQISPITRWSEATQKIFRPKFFENFFFQKCSECFNSCKKHVITILKKFSYVSAPDLVIFRPKIELLDFDISYLYFHFRSLGLTRQCKIRQSRWHLTIFTSFDGCWYA